MAAIVLLWLNAWRLPRSRRIGARAAFAASKMAVDNRSLRGLLSEAERPMAGEINDGGLSIFMRPSAAAPSEQSAS